MYMGKEDNQEAISRINNDSPVVSSSCNFVDEVEKHPLNEGCVVSTQSGKSLVSYMEYCGVCVSKRGKFVLCNEEQIWTAD